MLTKAERCVCHFDWCDFSVAKGAVGHNFRRAPSIPPEGPHVKGRGARGDIEKMLAKPTNQVPSTSFPLSLSQLAAKISTTNGRLIVLPTSTPLRKLWALKREEKLGIAPAPTQVARGGTVSNAPSFCTGTLNSLSRQPSARYIHVTTQAKETTAPPPAMCPPASSQQRCRGAARSVSSRRNMRFWKPSLRMSFKNICERSPITCRNWRNGPDTRSLRRGNTWPN